MWGIPFIGKERLSVDEEILSRPLLSTIPITQRGRLLTTEDIITHYGPPGNPDNLTTITTPYKLRLAWDPVNSTNKITCHKKIALRLVNVFQAIMDEYGLQKLTELGIDLYGGCYNFRPMRGCEKKYENAIKQKLFSLAYTYLSRHSWGIPIDLDPARNGLKTPLAKAQFGKKEYLPMKEIFYDHGFIGYGWERNNDAMHFEIGMLL